MMVGSDILGDRMKAYERAGAGGVFDKELPLIVRLDGRAFSTLTRGLDKPFDSRFTKIMDGVTEHLVEKTHPKIGYTQSDEITLIYTCDRPESELIFGGKAFKITSVLAGMASAKFCLLGLDVFPDRIKRLTPSFDCRAFSVPDIVEATNCLVWREMDASRNAIQQVAQSHFSPKQLHKKSCDALESMLAERGVVMQDFPVRNRHGIYYTRKSVTLDLEVDELARIPEKYRPSGPVTRSRVLPASIAPLRHKPDKVRLAFPEATKETTQ